MTSLRNTTLAVITTALATLLATPLIAPPSSPGPFGGISLSSSVISLTPTSQMAISTQVTAVGWEESPNGIKLTILPETGVAVKVGDSTGSNAESIPAGSESSVTFTKVSATTLSATLLITTSAGPMTYTLPVSSRGHYDPLDSAHTPTLEDFGSIPGDPTRERTRLWVNYFGIQSCITIMDG